MAAVKIVIDTNILVSAIVFRGKPWQILDLALDEFIEAVISPTLISELVEILSKKFLLPKEEINSITEDIDDSFTQVYPSKTLNIARDKDDNRVLESAVEGKCQYIVTGDKDLLDLGTFRKVKIVTAQQFLQAIKL